MNHLVVISVSITCAVLSFIGCKNSVEPPRNPTPGITVTQRDGSGGYKVLSVDTADWRLNPQPKPDFQFEQTGPLSTYISPAFPNPSSDSVSIQFSLSSGGSVTFRIFDADSNLVRDLFEQDLGAGFCRVNWNLKDDTGTRVKPGFYLCVYFWPARLYKVGTNHSQYLDVGIFGSGDIQVN